MITLPPPWQKKANTRKPAISSRQFYGWFSEGFDTPGLKEVNAPVDQLAWDNSSLGGIVVWRQTLIRRRHAVPHGRAATTRFTLRRKGRSEIVRKPALFPACRSRTDHWALSWRPHKNYLCRTDKR